MRVLRMEARLLASVRLFELILTSFFTLNLGTVRLSCCLESSRILYTPQGAVSILIGNISFPFGAQRGIGVSNR